MNEQFTLHMQELIAKLDGDLDAESRAELKDALKQLTDIKFALDESSIVALTDQKGRIQYFNKKFREISQYDSDELLGSDHRIINSNYHSKEFMKELWDTISSGRVWNGDIKNRAKDGSYYWVRTTIVPFLDEQGKPYQYLAIRNEVTELKKVQEELQQMMKQVIHIQEEERKRFSRELHDGIGQSLFSLLISIDRLHPDQGLPELADIRSTVSSIIEDVRNLAWELRPSVLDDLGVAPAIRTYIENYTEHYGIKVALESTLRRRVDPQVETTIYRTVQEALTNIGKYAGVESAKVTIEDLPGHIVVTIQDEGAGFDRAESRQGVGLFSIEERARAVGGHASITSAPNRGTRIVLTIPQHS